MTAEGKEREEEAREGRRLEWIGRTQAIGIHCAVHRLNEMKRKKRSRRKTRRENEKRKARE